MFYFLFNPTDMAGTCSSVDHLSHFWRNSVLDPEMLVETVGMFSKSFDVCVLLCLVTLCLVKLEILVNLAEHMSQTNRFSPL